MKATTISNDTIINNLRNVWQAEPGEGLKNRIISSMKENIEECAVMQSITDTAHSNVAETKKTSDAYLPRSNKSNTKRQTSIRRSIRLAAAIAVIALLVATTALAAWYLLKPSEVAELFNDYALSAAFESDSALIINASVTAGDYTFTLLGIVSGEDITQWPVYGEDNQLVGRTYAVVAIRHSDGRPLSDVPSEDYWSVDIKISPLIKGIEPWKANVFTLNGSAAAKVVDGIAYRIIACDDISIFAEHGLYLGIWTNDLVPFDAFLYDKHYGEISPNPDYDGVSVVFDLPIDKSLADPEKAEERLREINLFFSSAEPPQTSPPHDTVFTEDIDWDLAIPIEQTRMNVYPASAAMRESWDVDMRYTWDFEFGGGSWSFKFEDTFSDARTVESVTHEMTNSHGDGIHRYAVRLTKNEDMTVTGVVLVPNWEHPDAAGRYPEWESWQKRHEHLMSIPLKECGPRPEKASMMHYWNDNEYAFFFGKGDDEMNGQFRTSPEVLADLPFDENDIFRYSCGRIDDETGFLVAIKRNDDGTYMGMVYDVPMRLNND